MMASPKRDRSSYSAGEWGRNRVRAFADPRTGIIQIEWREKGRRRTRSLGHRNWARAKRQADELAAGYAQRQLQDQAEAGAEPLTLETPSDIHDDEVTPTGSEKWPAYHGAVMEMLPSSFGEDRDPGTLAGEDWDRVVRDLSSGRVAPGRKPASTPATDRELDFPLATLSEAWRMRASILRQYGSETAAMALEACAAELEVAWRRKDDTIVTLAEAARKSGYSAHHLGRLVREGKIPNVGRPGAPRIALRDLPRKALGPATEPDPAEEPPLH